MKRGYGRACAALTLMAALVAPGRAVVRAGLGGFYWSLDTPQANTLRGVVAPPAGTDGSGLVAVGDASTFLIRRSPITDPSSRWLAGRGRPVHMDTSYRGVARGPRSGLIGIAASDGTVLIGDGNTLTSLSVSTAPLSAAAWFETDKPRLAVAGDGVAYTYSTANGAVTAASLDASQGTPFVNRICALPDSSIGYAAARPAGPGGGGQILKTTDAGATWAHLPNAPLQDEYRDVYFLTPAVGFALGVSGKLGSVFRTSDGGASWSRVGTVSSAARAVTAMNTERIVVVGDRGIQVSAGGPFQSIAEPVSGLSAPIPLQDVDAAGSEAWAVGEGGVIFHSTDYGMSWSPVSRNGELDASQIKPWNAIQHLSSKDVYLAGDDGTIRRSFDGGRTFQTMAVPLTNDLYALAAPGQLSAGEGTSDGMPGIAVGEGRAVLTYNAGLDGWTARGAIPRVDYFGAAMLSLQDGMHRWAVGANGTIVANTGADPLWHPQGSGTAATLRAVHAESDKGVPWVIAVGDAGTILVSDDGASWTRVTPFPGMTFSTNLRGVFLRDTETAFAVGDGGTILRTLDGGRTWSRREAPTTADLYAVCATPSTDGGAVYAVGEHQTVLKSTNNGASWTLLPAPVPGAAPVDFTWRAVQAPAANLVYMAGDQGHRLRSGDAGSTWTETDGQTGAGYTALSLVGPLTGVSVGNGAVPGVGFTGNGFKSVASETFSAVPALYGASAVGDEVLVVGAAGTVQRALSVSFDTGGAFANLAAPLRAAASPAPGSYVVAGGAQAFYSWDDGATWQPSVIGNQYGPGIQIRALAFNPSGGPRAATGYMAGTVPGMAVPLLFHTTDAGKSWDPVWVDFGADNAGITSLAITGGGLLATAENGAVYLLSPTGAWSAARPVAGFAGPWLGATGGDGAWYVVGARGRAARYPNAAGVPEWQPLNTGTAMDITGISGPPASGFALRAMAGDGPGGSGQSLRDDVRRVCMRPEGVLLTDSGGIALFGDLDQNTAINALDGISSLLSISGGKLPDDDGYFFGDIFPPVPAPDVLPGDGILDIRDSVRVMRKTQGLE